MRVGIGDQVRVGSLFSAKPWSRERNRAATGTVREITTAGVVVDLHEAINGMTWCTADPNELEVYRRASNVQRRPLT